MQDNVIFCHVCNNPKYFDKVKKEFFDNESISLLYDVVKTYHHEYNQLPISFDEPDNDFMQLKQFMESTGVPVLLDKLKTKEDNEAAFWSIVPEIVAFPYHTMDQTYLVGADGKSGSFHQWLLFKGFTYSIKKATRFMKAKRDAGEMKGSEVPKVIKSCLDMINDGGNLGFTDGIGVDFSDPNAHIQTSPENLFRTGYDSVNKWLGEEGIQGGFEPGTLTFLWGASNVGKSIWLGNFAANLMQNGYNVLMVSNEMRTHKLAKRIGAKVLDVDVNTYSTFTSDISRVERKINDKKKSAADMFAPWGALRMIKIPKCTPSEIEYKSKEIEKKLGIKFHVILIDYFTNMGNDHGIAPDKTYSYHKTNADDLFAVAERTNTAIITAHQIKIGMYSMDDMTLEAGAESSGIIHAADNIWGIIQTTDMKKNNTFQLKNLKGRESRYKDWRTSFDIDYSRMSITNNNDMLEPDDLFI